MSLIGDVVKVGETILFHHDQAGLDAGFDVSPAIVTAIHDVGELVPQKISAEVLGTSQKLVKHFISFADDVDDDVKSAGNWFEKMTENALPNATEPAATEPVATPTAEEQIDTLVAQLSPEAKAGLLASLSPGATATESAPEGETVTSTPTATA
jgi:hypothetical protein